MLIIKKYAQFLRFCFVGGANTLLDISLYGILHQALNVNSIASSTITTTLVMIFSYFANSYFVFRRPVVLRTFIKFMITTSVGIVIIQGLLTGLLEPVIRARYAEIVGESTQDIFIANSITRITGTIFSLVWNYLFYKYIVFMIKSRLNAKTTVDADSIKD